MESPNQDHLFLKVSKEQSQEDFSYIFQILTMSRGIIVGSQAVNQILVNTICFMCPETPFLGSEHPLWAWWSQNNFAKSRQISSNFLETIIFAI